MKEQALVAFMIWQNRNAERLIRMSNHKIALEYLKHLKNK